MKKLSWITGMLVCVMVLLAALSSALNAVWQIAIDETFYNEQSRAAVKAAMGYTTEEEVSEYIGLTPKEQKFFAETASMYMLGEDQSIDLPFYVSKDEVRHMLDVRDLIWRARDLSKTLMWLSAVLAVAAAWTGSKLKHGVLVKLIGGLSAVGAVMLLVQGVMSRAAGSGFAQMFVKMHEVLFTNDLWMMDPQTDILIRIMPQQLFEQALLSGANMALRMFVTVLLVLFALHYIVAGMIRRHVVKGE